MSTGGKTKTIEQSTLIPARPEEVYDAMLIGKIHAEFTRSKATSTPKVGGKFTAYDGYIWGKHLELVKGRKIVQEWQTTEWPANAAPSIVEFNFEEKEGGTELTMIHSRVPEEQAESYRQGWIDYYWEPLEEYFRNR